MNEKTWLASRGVVSPKPTYGWAGLHPEVRLQIFRQKLPPAVLMRCISEGRTLATAVDLVLESLTTLTLFKTSLSVVMAMSIHSREITANYLTQD
jgi:hypothetical protein